MRFLILLALVSACAELQQPPTQADCQTTVTVLRGDCDCTLTVAYDADCRVTVVPSCANEPHIHELSLRQFPQSGVMDLGVVWTDGTTCKSVLKLPGNSN